MIIGIGLTGIRSWERPASGPLGERSWSPGAVTHVGVMTRAWFRAALAAHTVLNLAIWLVLGSLIGHGTAAAQGFAAAPPGLDVTPPQPTGQPAPTVSWPIDRYLKHPVLAPNGERIGVARDFLFDEHNLLTHVVVRPEGIAGWLGTADPYLVPFDNVRFGTTTLTVAVPAVVPAPPENRPNTSSENRHPGQH